MTPDELRTHRSTHTKFNSWWLNDAHGIPCSRVCGDCEDAVRATYNPEIFNLQSYADVVEEPVEPEGYAGQEVDWEPLYVE